MMMSVMSATFLFDVVQYEISQHLDRGIELMRCNHFADALVEFENVLILDPHDRYARWNRVLARLSLGDYARGLPEHDCAWSLYDWRALGPVKGNIDRILSLPVWHGERCRLISYHEMGFGDAIMTLRFLPELVDRCENVTLVVRPELVRLMQGHGATVVDTVPTDISGFDARVTFFNSIFTMGHSLKTIPSDPYIKSDFKFTGGRMGIAWSGNSQKKFDPDFFLSHLDTCGFELFALQKFEPIAGIVQLPVCNDFKDTADLMMTLDCIVTVDTAAAHLAGAIGHPNAHLLLPYLRDWRWWNKSVWYPLINIYPQDDPDDWSGPFEHLNQALHGG